VLAFAQAVIDLDSYGPMKIVHELRRAAGSWRITRRTVASAGGQH
jgi:hypothetical protein